MYASAAPSEDVVKEVIRIDKALPFTDKYKKSNIDFEDRNKNDDNGKYYNKKKGNNNNKNNNNNNNNSNKKNQKYKIMHICATTVVLPVCQVPLILPSLEPCNATISALLGSSNGLQISTRLPWGKSTLGFGK